MPTRYTPAPPMWLLALVLGALYTGLSILNIGGTGRAGGFITLVLLVVAARGAWLRSQSRLRAQLPLEVAPLAAWASVVAAFGYFGINVVGPDVPWSAASFYQSFIVGGALALVILAITTRRRNARQSQGQLNASETALV